MQRTTGPLCLDLNSAGMTCTNGTLSPSLFGSKDVEEQSPKNASNVALAPKARDDLD
jgi:hypothetical protein